MSRKTSEVLKTFEIMVSVSLTHICYIHTESSVSIA